MTWRDPVFFLPMATALGLALGSFYNVCVVRTLSGESIVFPGSKCPKCGHKLSWWENIPLLSYIMLRGRCRGCKQPISLRYPVLEAISGLWGLGLAYTFLPHYVFPFVLLMFIGGILLVASFIDLASFELPDKLTMAACILALGGMPFSPVPQLALKAVPATDWAIYAGGAVLLIVFSYIYLESKNILLTPLGALPAGLAAAYLLEAPMNAPLLGAACGAGLFWLLEVVFRTLRGYEGLGHGDIKLMIVVGALVGWRGLPISIVAGATPALLASVYFMGRAKDEGDRTMVPFGPFLSLGAMFYVIFGDLYWSWIMN